MWIEKLIIQNCRIIKKCDLEFSPAFNIIIGDNGSGKSSLIEALTLLSSGRSFRTSRIKEVIRFNKDSVLVSSIIRNGLDQTSHIGIEKRVGKTKIRINKQDIHSQSTLSKYLPVTVIHPDSIHLIVGSPQERRAFIDWIAFYQFSNFYPLWKRYKHILKQRNLCLKSSTHRYALDQWTKELTVLQKDIHQYREKSLKLIQPHLTLICKHLSQDINVKIILKSGLPKNTDLSEHSLLEFYKDRRSTDLKFGRTVHGVHRADIDILINDSPAIQSASRGQLKLLATALLLAQSRSIHTDDSQSGVVIIDDLAAELDTDNKNNLLAFLTSLKQQLFITSTPQSKISLKNAKVFHVKHGEISELSQA